MRLRHLYILTILVPFYVLKAQQPGNYKGKSEFDLKNYKADPRDRLIFEINYTN